MKKIALKNIIFALIVLVSLFLAAGLSTYYLTHSQRQSLNNLLERSNLLLTTMAYNASEHLIQESYSALEDVVNQTVQAKSISRALVTKRDGVIVADSDLSQVGEVCTDLNDLDRFEPRQGYYLNQCEDFWIMFKEVNLLNQNYGRVYIFLDTQDIEKSQQALLFRSLPVSALLLLLGLLLGWVLTKVMTRSIWTNVAIIQDIASGHREKRLKPGRIREIASLASSVNSMADHLLDQNQKLQEAQKSKELFISNMSHELQTPLNGIEGTASLILTRPGVSDSIKKEIQVIRSCNSYLHRMIKDLLTYEDFVQGKITSTLENFTLLQLVDTMEHLIWDFRSNDQITYTSEVASDTPLLYGEKDRIIQVLSILLSNAFKFTESGKVVFTADYRAGELIFHVIDSGPGISHAQKAMIFAPFSQLEDTYSKTRRGLGLGLDLAQRIVTHFGGSLLLESQEGQGSDFCLRFPVTPLSQAPLEGGGTSSQEENKKRMLIVEDEAVNRLFIVNMMKKQGFSVDASADGKDAWNKLQNQQYDIVLMDIGLPILNGREVTQKIRAHSGPNKGTPVVAVTAHSAKHDIQLCLAAGINDVITKPFRESQLMEKVALLLVQN